MIYITSITLAAAIHFSMICLYMLLGNIVKAHGVNMMHVAGKTLPKQKSHSMDPNSIVAAVLWGVFYYLTHLQ